MCISEKSNFENSSIHKCSKYQQNAIDNKYLISIGSKYVFLWFIYIIKHFPLRCEVHYNLCHSYLTSVNPSIKSCSCITPHLN